MSEPFVINLGPSGTLDVLLNPSPQPLTLTVPTSSGGNATLLIDTTAHWAAKTSYVPPRGTIIVYSDRNTIDEQNYMGVKIGDGMAYVVDLPFIGDDIAAQLQAMIEAHASDTEKHITAAERAYWNNKLDSELSGDTLILAPVILDI